MTADARKRQAPDRPAASDTGLTEADMGNLRLELECWDHDHSRIGKVYRDDHWVNRCRCEATFPTMSEFYTHRIDKLVDIVAARVAAAEQELRLHRYRDDGPCVCNTGPGTDGPDECCPYHGRGYTEWVERAEAAEQHAAEVVAKVRALAEEWVGWGRTRSTPRIDAFRDAGERLLGVLAPPEANPHADLFGSVMSGDWAGPAPREATDAARADERGEQARCQYVSPSPWGPTQCVLEADHDGRHGFSPSETADEIALEADPSGGEGRD